jgi:hypothetical protein
MKFLLVTALCLTALNAPFIAQARDISAEQKAASQAQDHYAQARADYDSVSQQVQAQEKYVAEQQAKLKALQEKQSAALVLREKAKVTMELKEKQLNDVWDQRNK